jgi:hypothetical protein
VALNVALMTWLCGYMNEVVFCGSHTALDVQMVEVRSLMSWVAMRDKDKVHLEHYILDFGYHSAL